MEKDARIFEKDAVEAAREYEIRELVIPVAFLFLSSILKILLVFSQHGINAGKQLSYFFFCFPL